MDIVGGIAAATQAVTIIRSIRDAERALDAATLKAQLADLIAKVADTKIALSEAKEALQLKDGEINRLRRAFEERAELVVGPDDYKYRRRSDGEPTGYPMCPACEAVDGRIVQLVRSGHWRNGQCPFCKSMFTPIRPMHSQAETEDQQLLTPQLSAMLVAA